MRPRSRCGLRFRFRLLAEPNTLLQTHRRPCGPEAAVDTRSAGAHQQLTPQALEDGEMPALPPLPRDLEAKWGIGPGADAGAAGAAEPMAALDTFCAPSLSPPLAPAHGVANAFSDVPDDLFGASFWCASSSGPELVCKPPS